MRLVRREYNIFKASITQSIKNVHARLHDVSSSIISNSVLSMDSRSEGNVFLAKCIIGLCLLSFQKDFAFGCGGITHTIIGNFYLWLNILSSVILDFASFCLLYGADWDLGGGGTWDMIVQVSLNIIFYNTAPIKNKSCALHVI